jgi:hypothetical protein
MIPAEKLTLRRVYVWPQDDDSALRGELPPASRPCSAVGSAGHTWAGPPAPRSHDGRQAGQSVLVMKDLANVVGGPLLRRPWGAAFSAGVGVSWPASSFHCRLSRGIFTLFARNLSLRISKASMTLKATLFLALLPTPQKE